MSEELLLQKISDQAAKEAEAIRAEANEQVANIKADTEVKLKKLEEVAAADLKKQQEHQELVLTSRATQAGNLKVQTAKREGIESVLAGAYQALKDQSSEDYVIYYAAQIDKSDIEQSDVESVEAPKNREEETKEILKKVKSSAKIDLRDSLDGGLIVHTVDGVYDFTLGRLFSEKRPILESFILKELDS